MVEPRAGRASRAACAGVFVAACLVLVAPAARADVPPPDACRTENAACNNAGASYNQAGVCRTSTCRRATPDGSMEFSCLLCLADGAGGAGGLGAGGSATGGSSKKGDDGCTIAPHGGEGLGLGLGTLTLAAALIGLRAGRRRR